MVLLVAALSFALSACAPKQPVQSAQGSITQKNPATQADSEDLSSEDEVPLDAELDQEPDDNQGDLSSIEQAALNSRFGVMFDLESHDTKEVQKYFTFYTHKSRSTFERWLERSQPHLPMVRRILTKHGLPQDLVMLPFAESGYNVNAYSWAGAGGMWQFMRGTGTKYGLKSDWWIDERRDPVKATEAAAKYLKELHERFGDWYLALAAYNAGEGKISRALQQTGCNDFFELSKNNSKLGRRTQLKAETRNYVPKFIAISKIFQNLDTLGFKPVSWDKEPELVAVDVPGGTDLLALAKAGDMSWRDFSAINAAYRRQVSPPHMTTTAYLPKERVEKMVAYLADPGSRPYAGYVQHKVRNGDSWWRISNKYGVPVAVLKKMNNMHSNILRPGQHIMVPGRGSSSSVADAVQTKTQKLAVQRGNYVVKSGDTLWSISKRCGVSVSTLKESNGLRSNSLKTGQKLFIPDNSSSQIRASAQQAEQVKAQLVQYRVQRGDNLSAIARKFGVTVTDLKRWNSLDSSFLKVGQRLSVYVP